MRESIVVTATGTPTPQPQTGAATSVLGPQELELYHDLVNSSAADARDIRGSDRAAGRANLAVCAWRRFRRQPGADRWRECRRSWRSIRLRASFDDRGGTERDLSWTEFEPLWCGCRERRCEYDDSARHNQFSIAARFMATGEISITSREDLEAAGRFGKLDYLGAYSWLQTANDLPNDQFHIGTAAANFGFQPTGSTVLRGTLYYGVNATGVSRVLGVLSRGEHCDRKRSGSLLSARPSITRPRRTSTTWCAMGPTRKREQFHLWEPTGDGCILTRTAQLRRLGDNHRSEWLLTTGPGA